MSKVADSESVLPSGAIFSYKADDEGTRGNITAETPKTFRDELGEGGSLTSISFNELTKEAQSLYNNRVATIGLKQRPKVYLSSDLSPPTPAVALLANVPSVGLVYVVNQAAHRWTEKWLKDNVETTEEYLGRHKLFVPETLEEKEFEAAFLQMSERQGIVPAPKLVLWNNPVSIAQSNTTKEGDNFVTFDPSASIRREELLALIEHELGHLKHHDNEIKCAVLLHNSNALGREAELAADQEVVNAGRAKDMISFLKSAYQRDMANGSFATIEQLDAYIKLYDPVHPSPLQRLDFLQQEMPETPPSTPKVEKTPSTASIKF